MEGYVIQIDLKEIEMNENEWYTAAMWSREGCRASLEPRPIPSLYNWEGQVQSREH